MKNSELLTIPQAAAELTVSIKTAWRMRYKGKFEVVLIGRSVRVTRRSVKNVIDANTTPPRSYSELDSTASPEILDDEE